MRFYTVSKNRYYYQSAINVGLRTHWNFTSDIRSARLFVTRKEAESLCKNANENYNGMLNNYKGKFRVREFEITEVK